MEPIFHVDDLVSKIVDVAKSLSNSKKVAVLFDVDGTLVDVSSIQHLVDEGLRQFDTFHRESVNCPPHFKVLAIAQGLLKEDIDVLAISGRQEHYRALTDYWLAMHSLPLHELILRPNEYDGNRIQFKTEVFANLSLRYHVVAVFDNDPQLISLWLTKDVPFVVQCPELILLERD
jgi:hypothetical protein